MRIVVLSVLSSLLLLCGCGSSSHQQQQNGFSAPNSLMSQEIDSRIDQIPYQHREELLQNLLWLSQSGEQTIPALLKGLSHDNPKVRSSCAWVLGRMRDRRVINDMEKHASDQSETVRLEVCRTLVVLGDLKFSPMLIEGLDSDHKEVRFLCHEALKSSTGRDFGYDHLSEDATQRRTAVLGWRQWWSEYSGDPFFAQNYMQRYGLQAQPAQPAGETQPTNGQPQPNGQQPNGQQPNGQQPNGQQPNGQQPPNSQPPVPNGETPGNGNGNGEPTGGNGNGNGGN